MREDRRRQKANKLGLTAVLVEIRKRTTDKTLRLALNCMGRKNIRNKYYQFNARVFEYNEIQKTFIA